jgi:hypothetical protein
MAEQELLSNERLAPEPGVSLATLVHETLGWVGQVSNYLWRATNHNDKVSARLHDGHDVGTGHAATGIARLRAFG